MTDTIAWKNHAACNAASLSVVEQITYLVMPPTNINEDGSDIGAICTDVFGLGWGSLRIAHLSTGDRVGVEIFQFANAMRPENNFEYWMTGIFHFCVRDPDVEGLAAHIVAAGGR